MKEQKVNNSNMYSPFSQSPVFMSFKPLSSNNTIYSSKQGECSASFGYQSITKSQNTGRIINTDKQNLFGFRNNVPNESPKQHIEPHLTISITNSNQLNFQGRNSNQPINFAKVNTNTWRNSYRNNQHTINTIKQNKDSKNRGTLNEFSLNRQVHSQPISNEYLIKVPKNSKNSSFGSVNSFKSFSSFGKTPIILKSQNDSMCLQQSGKLTQYDKQRGFWKKREVIEKNNYNKSKAESIIEEQNWSSNSNSNNISYKNLSLNKHVNEFSGQSTQKRLKAQKSKPQLIFDQQKNKFKEQNRKLNYCRSVQLFQTNKNVQKEYFTNSSLVKLRTLESESEHTKDMVIQDNFESVLKTQTEISQSQRQQIWLRDCKSEKQQRSIDPSKSNLEDKVTCFTDYYNTNYAQLSLKYMRALDTIKQKDDVINHLKLSISQNQSVQSLKNNVKISATADNLHQIYQNPINQKNSQLINLLHQLKSQNYTLKSELKKAGSQKELLQTKLTNINLKVIKMIDKSKQQMVQKCLSQINQAKTHQTIENNRILNFFYQ